MRIGSTIRELRQQRNMTQADLAERAGIRQETLCRIERGRGMNPTFLTVEALLDVLGHQLVVQPNALIDRG